MLEVLSDEIFESWIEQYLIRDSRGEFNQVAIQHALPHTEKEAARQIREVFFEQFLQPTQSAKQWYTWNGTIFVRDLERRVTRIVSDYGNVYARVLDIVKQDGQMRMPDGCIRERELEAILAGRDNPVDVGYIPGWKKHVQFQERLHTGFANPRILTELTNFCSFDKNKFDPPGAYIVLKNGVLDFEKYKKTGIPVVEGHDKSRYPTMMANASLGVTGSSVESVGYLWDWYLERSVPDAEARDYLRRWCGQALLGECQPKGFLSLVGKGGTGKSIFINVIASVFGSYAKSIDVDMIMEQRGKKSEFHANDLRGKRLVVAEEPDEGKRMDTGFVKKITGRGMMSTRGLWEENTEWKAGFTLIVASNSHMILNQADEAILGRVFPVEFPIVFSLDPWAPEERRADVHLEDKLLRSERERRRVFEWLLEGLEDFWARGSEVGGEPASVLAKRESMAEEMAPALVWVKEMLDWQLAEDWSVEDIENMPKMLLRKSDEGDPMSHCVTPKELFGHYDAWCLAQGISSGSVKQLTNNLLRLYGGEDKKLRQSNNRRVLPGLVQRHIVLTEAQRNVLWQRDYRNSE